MIRGLVACGSGIATSTVAQEAVKKILTEAGFEVLHNESRSIYYKDAVIDLLGLENTGDCSGLINENNNNHFKIALVHQPDYFTQIKESSVQLQLSGHTLGGYYKLPFIGSIETKEKGKGERGAFQRVEKQILRTVIHGRTDCSQRVGERG